MKKRRDRDKYIPGDDEIRAETGGEVQVANNEQVLKTGQVDFPEVDNEMAMGEFETKAAQQVGRFGDQVKMGSPAAEAGTIGQDAIKETIEASKRKLKEKFAQKEDH